MFICFLYVFSYHSSENGNQFCGTSHLLSFMLPVIGGVGQLAALVALIWSLWLFDWWQPILAYVCSILLGGLIAPLFQGKIIGILLSPILVVLFGVLSFWSLACL